jgi:hypothetical protein
VAVEVDLAELWIGEEAHVDQFSGRASFDGLTWNELHAEALTESGEQAVLDYGPGEDGYTLYLKTSNSGKLLQRLAVTDEYEGGVLELTASRPKPTGSFQGTFKLTQLTVVRSPATAKILRVASWNGLLDTLKNEGLRIRLAEGEIVFDHNHLEMSDVRLYGDGFGVTGDGVINIAEGTLDIHGSFTPVSTLQRVLGKIPLLGYIVAGRKREGVISTLFTLRGPLADPDVKVNAFSALTPGILREVFKLSPKNRPPTKKKSES